VLLLSAWWTLPGSLEESKVGQARELILVLDPHRPSLSLSIIA